jgi:hypothetical protein
MKHLLYNCFLFLLVILFAYINSLHSVDGFTPGVRAFYRPFVRRTRMVGEGFYDKTSTNISNLFRKFGIM